MGRPEKEFIRNNGVHWMQYDEELDWTVSTGESAGGDPIGRSSQQLIVRRRGSELPTNQTAAISPLSMIKSALRSTCGAPSAKRGFTHAKAVAWCLSFGAVAAVHLSHIDLLQSPMAPPSAMTPPPTDTNVNTTSGLTKKSSAYVKLWQEKVRGGFAPFPVSASSGTAMHGLNTTNAGGL